MAGNDELRRNLRDKLAREPEVDAEAIAVSAEDGRITLRGTVGSPREKEVASEAARHALGVVAVDNELQVRTLNERTREDRRLRADVLQALMLNDLVPRTVDVTVDGGLVSLTGSVSRRFQRDEAELVASTIVHRGKIANEIECCEPPVPDLGAVRDAIAGAVGRDETLDARKLEISTAEGVVTIAGRVRTWAQHDDVLAAVWTAPGVTAVHDRIVVD